MSEMVDRVGLALNHYAAYPFINGKWYVYDMHAWIRFWEDKPNSDLCHPPVIEEFGDSISCQERVIELNARAAIEAMREPTDEMVDAGARAMVGSDQDALDCWPAMIDEALNG